MILREQRIVSLGFFPKIGKQIRKILVVGVPSLPIEYFFTTDPYKNRIWRRANIWDFNRGAHRSCFWSIFDSFFICFCRHRSSKMNRKMRSVNLTPLKFSKMSEKWNNTFFGTLTALNSAARCRLRFILSLSEYCLSASNLPRVFTNYSLVY